MLRDDCEGKTTTICSGCRNHIGDSYLLSLVFVGFQIADGNREANAATFQASLDTEMYFQTQILSHADIWDKMTKGEALAEGAELRRALILYNMMMTLNENRLEQYNSGYLDVEPAILVNETTGWPIFEIWVNSTGANSRSSEFMEFVYSIRNNSVE